MSVTDAYDELKQHMNEAKERFASEVEGATTTVLKDGGLYRHLRFNFPRASWGWCEIVTWPDMLVLRGGLGYWSFSRVEDMLGFFRELEDVARIDPVYMAQNLVPDGADSAKEYDPERAAAYIRQTMADHADKYPDMAKDAEDWIFSDWCGEDLGTETGLRTALGRFEGRNEDYSKDDDFRFPIETWELYRYCPWFLLSCVVLPWAVAQYDGALVTAS